MSIHPALLSRVIPIQRVLLPFLFLFSAILWSGCDVFGWPFRSCPGDFPQHFPIAEGDSYTYAYNMKEGGGLSSGEDRGHGMVTWRVEEPLTCRAEGLSVRISTESTIVTEYRTLAGEDQSWKLRDSTHTTGFFRANYSADEGLSGVMGEPIAPNAFRSAPDTLEVVDGDGAFQESATRTFVRGIGMIRHAHWERFGLGGGSRSVTLELVEEEG